MLTGGSFKLCSIAGTVVRVHPTLFPIAGLGRDVYWRKGGPSEAGYGVVFIGLD